MLRTGGRARCWEFHPGPIELDFARDIISKGAIVQGNQWRKMFETWFQMEAAAGHRQRLNLEPAINPSPEGWLSFRWPCNCCRPGEAIKVILRPDDCRRSNFFLARKREPAIVPLAGSLRYSCLSLNSLN